MRNNPRTGRFAKGNPGRPEGSKNERTRQWEELGCQITEANAARFNQLLGRLWDSPDMSEQIRAAELFLKVAEFFKPKLQRIQTTPEHSALIPPLIAHDGVVRVPENWPGPIINIRHSVIPTEG
mgnify:CR=1 FL=1